MRLQLAVVVSVVALACDATRANGHNNDSLEQERFATLYDSVRVASEYPAWFRQFLNQVNGDDWSSDTTGIFSIESELMRVNWIGVKQSPEKAKAYADSISAKLPLSDMGISSSKRQHGAFNLNTPEIPDQPAVLSRIPSLHYVAGNLKQSFLSAREYILLDAVSFAPYVPATSRERTWLDSEYYVNYLELAYLAMRLDKQRLSEKFLWMAKFVNDGLSVRCPDMDAQIRNRAKDVKKSDAEQKIKELYIQARLYQRVNYLADKKVLPALTKQEQTDWAKLKAQYCNSGWYDGRTTCTILSQENGSPLGYGKALEEEWAAGD